jgi:hypothetical protein
MSRSPVLTKSVTNHWPKRISVPSRAAVIKMDEMPMNQIDYAHGNVPTIVYICKNSLLIYNILWALRLLSANLNELADVGTK